MTTRKGARTMLQHQEPRSERRSRLGRVAAAAALAFAVSATAGVAKASSQVAISFDLNEVAPVVYRELGVTSATVPEIQLDFDGWTFEGWNTREDGSGADIEAGTTVSSSTTLYAQWERSSSLDDVIDDALDGASSDDCESGGPVDGGDEAPIAEGEEPTGDPDGVSSTSGDVTSADDSEESFSLDGDNDDIALLTVVEDDSGTHDVPDAGAAEGTEDTESSESDERDGQRSGLGSIVSSFAGDTVDRGATEADDVDEDETSKTTVSGNGYVPTGTTEATLSNMPNTAQAPYGVLAIVVGGAVSVAAILYVRKHGVAGAAAALVALAVVCSGATVARAEGSVVGFDEDGMPISGTVTVGDRTWGWSGGELVRGRVINISGELMRFDDDGLLVVEGWHSYGGEDTYFEEGDRVYDEVVELEDGSFAYLGTDGKPMIGVIAVKDRVYFADKQGRLLEPGWHVLGTEYGFESKQLVHIDSQAYAAVLGYSEEGYPHWTRPEGYVVRGKWVDAAGITHLADGRGRLMPDGWVVTDLFDDQVRRYWIDSETHSVPKSGLVVVDGETYVIGEDGYVLTGPTLSGGVLVLADDQGRCVVGTGWTYADELSTSAESSEENLVEVDEDLPPILADDLDVPRASGGAVYYMTTGLGGVVGARVGLFEVDGREYFADRATGALVMGAEHWDEETSTMYVCGDDGVVLSKTEMDEPPLSDAS